MRVNKPFVTVMALILLLSGVLLLMCPSTRPASAHVPPPSAPELCPLTGLPSTSLSLDGVELRLCTSFLPAANFATPDPDDAIQVATAVEMGRGDVFEEFSITAISFGTKPSTESLPRAAARSEEVYRATLRDYREKQGGNPQAGPGAHFFGQRVVGSVSVVDLHVDGIVARPVAITEWVVEAGSRIWIVRASQKLPSAEMSRSQVLSLVSPLDSTELNSPDLSRPSTSAAAAGSLLPRSYATLDNISASQSITSDLPFPPWWDGDCDTNNYYAETGIPAYPLGAVHRGVKACGPRPWADGAPEVWVAFFPGAVEQLEWQCPELSKRFMYLAYDIAPYSANGSQVVWNCDVDTNGCWLEQIANGAPGQAPQPDDILSYGETCTWGHTSVVAGSIVDSNGDGTIVVIEQNSSPDGSNTLTVNDWVVSNAVSGWLHDPRSDNVPPSGVTVAGPTTGVVQAGYAFIATASPITATAPITYVWQATGQLPVTNTGGLSDTVAFTWNTTGTQAITVTAANAGGTVTGTHVISIYIPVQASFGAAPLAGQPPLTVVFTDTSTGSIATQLWDFGGGITGTAQHPTHTYACTGTFSVSLTVSGPGGSDTEIKTNYVRVSDKPIIANFTAHPASGPAPLAVQFADASAGDITAWQWDFGDGSTLLTTGGSTLLTTGGLTGTQPGPTHVYTTAGIYTVSLTVSGSGITDTCTRPRDITVYESVYLPLLLHNYTSPPAPCVEGIANGGFEDDSAWVIPDTDYPATYTTAITHTGDRSMRVGIVEPGDNRYSYSSARQTVTIPAGAFSATLRFWLYPMTGESLAKLIVPSRPLAGDWQYVLILNEDDQTLDTLLRQRTDDRQWVFHQFDLGAYAGQTTCGEQSRTIKLQFGVYNDGTDGVTAMYVDDVSLELCAGGL
ncbi:MAG: PKD domain-containing protein [Anaerolineae bacterium]|nr:PKD domain-containing protein [Anaerolineae bacterium]